MAPEAWLGARVILVQCPDNPDNPNGVLTPDFDFDRSLVERFPTLKEVGGPYVNGIIALTWEDDEASTEDLIARSAQAVQAAIA